VRLGVSIPMGPWTQALNPAATEENAVTPEVGSLAVQADGKILVGGSFAMLGGDPQWPWAGSMRGTLDNSFNPGAAGVAYGPWIP